MSVIPPVDLTGQFRTIQSDVNAAVAEVLGAEVATLPGAGIDVRRQDG